MKRTESTSGEQEALVGSDEASALLSPSNSNSYFPNHDHSNLTPKSFREHAQWIIHKSIPIVATSLLHQAVKWIVIIVAGHLVNINTFILFIICYCATYNSYYNITFFFLCNRVSHTPTLSILNYIT